MRSLGQGSWRTTKPSKPHQRASLPQQSSTNSRWIHSNRRLSTVWKQVMHLSDVSCWLLCRGCVQDLVLLLGRRPQNVKAQTQQRSLLLRPLGLVIVFNSRWERLQLTWAYIKNRTWLLEMLKSHDACSVCSGAWRLKKREGGGARSGGCLLFICCRVSTYWNHCRAFSAGSGSHLCREDRCG